MFYLTTTVTILQVTIMERRDRFLVIILNDKCIILPFRKFPMVLIFMRNSSRSCLDTSKDFIIYRKELDEKFTESIVNTLLYRVTTVSKECSGSLFCIYIQHTLQTRDFLWLTVPTTKYLERMFDVNTYARCANTEFSSPISKSFFCSLFQLLQPLLNERTQNDY